MTTEQKISELKKELAQLENQLKDEQVSSVYPSNKKVADYLCGPYAGRELLKKYKLDEVGIWEVYGEDPNCDLGGHHHTPKLGIFSGKLSDVLEIAVNLSNFYTWGSGGEIRKIQIQLV